MITTSATARHDILGIARRRSRSPAPVLSVSVFAHPSTTLLLTSTLQRYVAISTEYLTIINYKQLLLLLLLLLLLFFVINNCSFNIYIFEYFIYLPSAQVVTNQSCCRDTDEDPLRQMRLLCLRTS